MKKKIELEVVEERITTTEYSVMVDGEAVPNMKAVHGRGSWVLFPGRKIERYRTKAALLTAIRNWITPYSTQ